MSDHFSCILISLEVQHRQLHSNVVLVDMLCTVPPNFFQLTLSKTYHNQLGELVF